MNHRIRHCERENESLKHPLIRPQQRLSLPRLWTRAQQQEQIHWHINISMPPLSFGYDFVWYIFQSDALSLPLTSSRVFFFLLPPLDQEQLPPMCVCVWERKCRPSYVKQSWSPSALFNFPALLLQHRWYGGGGWYNISTWAELHPLSPPTVPPNSW